MPITPDNLVELLIPLAQKKSQQFELWRDIKIGGATALGAVTGAVIGAVLGVGVGSIIGGTVGTGVTFPAAWYLVPKKLQTAPDILRAIDQERKKQLYELFCNRVLGLKSCDAETLKALLMGDSEAENQTIKILKIFFQTYMMMDVEKLATFSET